jgi:hypothetical protein
VTLKRRRLSSTSGACKSQHGGSVVTGGTSVTSAVSTQHGENAAVER